jgi:hypothetical protein
MAPIAGVAAITLFAGILATIAVVGALYLAAPSSFPS